VICDIALVACFLPEGQGLFEISFGACEIRLLLQDLAQTEHSIGYAALIFRIGEYLLRFKEKFLCDGEVAGAQLYHGKIHEGVGVSIFFAKPSMNRETLLP
jgi:hypothetical protein